MPIDHSQSLGLPKPGPRKKRKNRTRHKKTVSRRKMVIALDKAARKDIVEDRDQNVCQRCGRVAGEFSQEYGRIIAIQWCHVQSREYYITRWEPDNSFAGCECCHTWFDNHKVLSLDWFAKKWPERWERILRVLQSGAKPDVKSLYAALTI
jgi:hypothetical protein